MAELTKPSVASATTAPSISFGDLTPEDSALLLRLAERQKQLVEVTARARALGALDGAAAPAAAAEPAAAAPAAAAEAPEIAAAPKKMSWAAAVGSPTEPSSPALPATPAPAAAPAAAEDDGLPVVFPKWWDALMRAATSREREAAPSRAPWGLLNQGNTCFVNATLQALLACPPLAALLAEACRRLPELPCDVDGMVGSLARFYEAQCSQLEP